MKRRIVVYGSVTLGVLALVLSYKLGRAFAAGIPTSNPLVYTGTLFNNGAPENGSHFILLKVFGTSDGGSSQVCLPATQTVTVKNGSFSVPLDSSCLAAVHQNPNLSIDVTVDGTDMGQTPLTAVPYAVEADTASNYAPGSQISNLVPPGSVQAYAGVVGGSVSPPPGWLLCDGSAVSRTTYAALFAAIGTTAGGGDGATTFNLPDYRGLFLRGFDQGNGEDPDGASRTAMNSGGNTGDKVGTVESDQLASHVHYSSGSCSFMTAVAANVGDGPACGPSSCSTGNLGYMGDEATTGNAGGSETRPKNAFVNYLIKY